MYRKKSNKKIATRKRQGKPKWYRRKRLSAKTADLIARLQSVVKRNIKRWDEKYPDVIRGFHVAKKIKKGKVKSRYAIVFHVDKKILDTELTPKQRLPRKVTVTIPGRGRVTVPTDVIEAGRARLLANAETSSFLPGTAVSESAGQLFGTMGPLLTKNGEFYIVSNMHVLGASYLADGRKSVTIPRQNQQVDIVARANAGRIPLACFEKGIFGQLIDAAIARVPDPALVQAVVPGFGIPKGFKTLRSEDVFAGGYPVAMVGSVSEGRGKVTDPDAIKDFDSPIGPIRIFGLLRIDSLVAQDGDSGSTLIDDQRNVIGIIVGADSVCSYAVSIETVLLNFGVLLHTI